MMATSGPIASDAKTIEFRFSDKPGTGLSAIIHGKGVSYSLSALLLVVLFVWAIVFMVPYRVDLAASASRCFLVLACAFIVYQFSRCLVEVVIEEGGIRLRTFKRYRSFSFDSIKRVSITYFTTWGVAMIVFKVDGKRHPYFFWGPVHERERYEVFLRFLDTLKSASAGRFTVSFRN